LPRQYSLKRDATAESLSPLAEHCNSALAQSSRYGCRQLTVNDELFLLAARHFPILARLGNQMERNMQSIEIAKPRPAHLHMIGQACTDPGWGSPCPCGRRFLSRPPVSRSVGLADRCWNRTADRVGGTLSDYVRVRFVHDGQKSSILFEPAEAGAGEPPTLTDSAITS